MTRLPGGVGVFLVVAIVLFTAGCGTIANELEGVQGPSDETDVGADGEENDSSAEDGNATDESSDADDNESEADDANESDPPDSDDDETGADESDRSEDGDTGGDSDDQDDGDDQGDDGDQDGEATEPGQSSITLTVVGPAGEPIEGATVSGEGEPHDADIPLEFGGETDSEGQYTSVIYENEYTILVDHPDYEATTVDHDHDGENEVTVELEREGTDGSEPATSLLSLSVVDSDGEPIEGATVSGEGEPHDADIPLTFSGETDADGQYTDVIYENQYSIEVDHPDYEATTVDHDHDGESEITVELESDNDGEPKVVDSSLEAGDRVDHDDPSDPAYTHVDAR